MNTTSQMLEEHGIRPSVQRIQVYDYLLEHRTHPTVDEIFAALAPQIPTLSKTTVYNTLTLLVEKGLVQELNIDDKNLRYDACMEAHIHFQCQRCGKIHDLPYPIGLNLVVPENFALHRSEISCYGICDACQEQKH